MRTVIIHMDDEDFDQLKELKGKETWRSLLLAYIKQKGDLDGED